MANKPICVSVKDVSFTETIGFIYSTLRKYNYKCFLQTAMYISLPPTSSILSLLTIRFVKGPCVPSMHSMHIADNLKTLSARGTQSKISPILPCL